MFAAFRFDDLSTVDGTPLCLWARDHSAVISMVADVIEHFGGLANLFFLLEK